ncbi:Protein of unknown function, partial [Cotesia congregata]
MNPSKCETIVFRVPARTVTKTKRVKIENFTICTFNPDTKAPVTIPTKGSLKSIDNSLIQRLSVVISVQVKENAQTGYLQPQDFTVLDRQGVIQDHFNMPVIYHKSRHMSDKKILWSENQNYTELKYSKAIPDLDKNNFYRLDKKF